MVTVKPPEHIIQVLQCLAENGYDAYLVGGCVRDSIMGRPVHDWDIASSATPDEVEKVFEKTVQTGKKCGTVTVILPGITVEVTTFRTESGYNDGRRPDNVEFVKSLDEDLSRRDFTMNAIAVSDSGEMIDPFGGVGDIKKRMIRCVGAPGERFSEDALRMFRAFRFSAELGFEIEAETLSSIKSNAKKARAISAERVRIELEKTLLSQKPEIAGEMIETGLLARNISSDGKCPDGLNNIAALPSEAVLRWCLFCAMLLDYDLIKTASDFLRAMRLDSNTIKTCDTALSAAMFSGGSEADDRVGVKKLLSKHGIAATRCAAAVHDTMHGKPHGTLPDTKNDPLHNAAHNSLHGKMMLQCVTEVLQSGECFSLETLAISGSDLVELGYEPGPELGGMLSVLLDYVVERPEANTREVLIGIIEEMTDR